MGAAVTTRTQELLMTLLGVIGFKIVLTDTYLHYVNAWMKWPILAASFILVAVSMRYLFGTSLDSDHHDIQVPAVTWLLLLPVLVLFAIAPPELGAYAAERRTAVSAPKPPITAPSNLGPRTPVKSLLSDFTSLAQWEPANNVSYRPVILTGFVSKGPRDSWYVTRLGISCCAADAVVYRIRVVGAPAPNRDQWVQVTGTWIDPHKKVPRLGDIAITATTVTFVAKPRNTYE
jgi:uncharacterized repeat protein (TIGR03943 family)